MNTPLSSVQPSVQTPSQLSLSALFQRPFPIVAELPASSLRTALAFGAFVTLFLTIFPPFGLGGLPRPVFYIHTLGYGLLCSCIMLLNFFGAPRLFPTIFIEERWTVGKHIAFSLWNVISVALGNIVYTAFVFDSPITFTFIARFIGITLLIGTFPVVILTMMQERRLLRQNIDEASTIAAHLNEHLDVDSQSPPNTITKADNRSAIAPNRTPNAFIQESPNATIPDKSLPSRIEPDAPNQDTDRSVSIVFEGASAKERFETDVERLLCLQASDNYVTVFALSADTSDIVESAMLRMTLKYAEEVINSHSQVVRCHKSYIVNLKHVKDISGNAQGYKLHIPALDFAVPVSRSYQERISHAFQEHYLQLKQTLASARKNIQA